MRLSRKRMLCTRDKRILAQLQNGFPLVSRPYALMARRLNMDPDTFLAAVKALRRRGLIRYIGATFDVKRCGCVSTLAALHVPPAKIKSVAACIQRQPRITHNYLRPGRLNMWFTLSGRSAAENRRLIESIKRRCGLSAAWEFPAEKIYKIDARFALGRKSACASSRKIVLRKSQRRIAVPPAADLAVLAREIPLCREPFAAIGSRHGRSQQQVIACLRRYRANGFIRRLGAVLEHNRVGLRYNCMVAWETAEGGADALGSICSRIPQISHCYRRRPGPGWPYDFYTMVHASSAAESRGIIALILRRNKHTIKQYKVLPTLAELKKTRMDPRWMRKPA